MCLFLAGAVFTTTGGSELPAPYPAEGLSAMKTPYTLQPNSYPQQPPYPLQPPPYPLQSMPYPGQAPYYSSSVMPHPAHQSPCPCPPNPAPYPPPSTQQTLSTSAVESLYPPQEATNPYFRMPQPGERRFSSKYNKASSGPR